MEQLFRQSLEKFDSNNLYSNYDLCLCIFREDKLQFLKLKTYYFNKLLVIQ